MKKNLLIVLILIAMLGCKGKEMPKDEAPLKGQEVKIPADTKEIQKKTAPSPEEIKPNQPPRVTSVDGSPLFPKIGDTIKITAIATDPEGDEIKLTYQWLKNNEPLPETSDSLSITNDFKRGDKITLYVFPDDGKAIGSYGLMMVTIGNSPPEITSSANEGKLENRVFTYQVKATDPEGDSLTYSLKTAPAGMAIEPTTGLVQWDVPVDFSGRTTVTIAVKDSQGGESGQNFILEISAGM